MTTTCIPTDQATRHARYYLDTLTFQVEDRLFKVPRHHFACNSEVFAEAFALPGAGDEGTNDENPIKLERVSITEFERLLEVLYPLTIPLPSLSKEHWISVLKLATWWRFLDTRELAIKTLGEHKIESTEQIILARTYNIGHWLRSGYVALAQKGISVEDAGIIGMDTAFKICHLRETSFSRFLNNNGNYGESCPPVTHFDVEKVFAEEFRQADLISAGYIPESNLRAAAIQYYDQVFSLTQSTILPVLLDS
ncbi:hypothetical protein FB451DRAFT_1042443 [Mycena latifolia]|nr:hypothetical protein FB451DRAFT_1042443 [Mycena latifolia]